MKRVVLDASVALAWFVDQPFSPYAADVRAFLLSGGKGVVPFVWHLEIANVLAMILRRGTASLVDIELCVSGVENIASNAIETVGDMPSIRQAFGSARLFQLTAHDAVYLDLAQREGLPLATLDKQLREAAIKAGVTLFK